MGHALDLLHKVVGGGSLEIAPLRKLPMIKDLVNVMDSFF